GRPPGAAIRVWPGTRRRGRGAPRAAVTAGRARSFDGAVRLLVAGRPRTADPATGTVTGHALRGLVLAAGAGRRLEPLTRDLPKTLLEVAPDTTILDIALSNLAASGITDVVVVTGFAAHQIDDRVELLEKKHGVAITTL